MGHRNIGSRHFFQAYDHEMKRTKIVELAFWLAHFGYIPNSFFNAAHFASTAAFVF